MTRGKRAARGAVVVMAVGGLGAVIAVQPAEAHAQYARIGTRGTVQISTSHASISVCDTAADGVGVSVEFWTRGGSFTHYYSMGDANGSQQGCGNWTFQGGTVVDRFNGHAANGVSTGWINVT